MQLSPSVLLRAAWLLLAACALATAQQLYMLFGVSCIVDMGDYRQVSEVLQIQQMIPAFALGARACISLVQAEIFAYRVASGMYF